MRRKFERDPDNRIIGGVCGGLARYFRVSSKLLRFLFFLSIFFSFSLTFWGYLLLWVAVPLRRSMRGNLSRDLRKRAARLDRLAQEACGRFNRPGLAARLQAVQELIETLLPDFNKNTPELRPVAQAALEHLPDLLDNFLRLPTGYAQAVTANKNPQEQLAAELAQLERTLHKVIQERYGQQFSQTADALDDLQTRYADDPTAPFRQKLEALQARAADRLDAAALAKIENIKSSLLAALGRLQSGADETDQNLYNVRQIALAYLPDTVDKYLSLPASLAGAELAQGKTAQAALHEQLDLLDGALNRLVTSLFQEDAQGLLVHGHFLRDKFIDPQKEWMER